MSGLRYFDDIMHCAIERDRLYARAQKIITQTNGIYEQELRENQGRRTATAMQAAGEKAAAILILRDVK